MFEEQVKKTPEAIAASYENEQITYKGLEKRANQLAHYLQKHGVGPESLRTRNYMY
ncbi:Polyketide synthase PksJ [Streptococcus pneumoniae]|nr:Polyketide synthase PksJ [Streptococcus pneumoniae]